MTLRVPVEPALLRWARERSQRPDDELRDRFPRLADWERQKSQPTLKQLEAFAKATYTPVGFLFLKDPPIDEVPIPDFRTVGNEHIGHPSPHLLDTVYMCQQRQDWYHDHCRSVGDEPLPFVGSVRLDADVRETAAAMRRTLGFDLAAQCRCPTWTDALREFIARADDAGVLVMCTGVVGSNTRRALDAEEFRGFALADDLAPLVFINGADTKAAQMFTLAHELAHVWLAETGLSDIDMARPPSAAVERWCDAVAAEFLVPVDALREATPPGDPLARVEELAGRFKVSQLVVLRRLRDAGRLPRAKFDEVFAARRRALIERARSRPPGGNFYLTQKVRVSVRFSRALVASTLEGTTMFREACRMLGITKVATFQKLAQSLGYPE